VADAAVPRPRQDEALIDSEEIGDARRLPLASHLPRSLILLWAALVVLLPAFLLFGSVRIGAGNWNGRRMSVPLIWSRFVAFLSDQGASAGVIAVVVATAALTLVGCAWLLWLAFGLYNQEFKQTSEGPEER
jgi:hypothetical protein